MTVGVRVVSKDHTLLQLAPPGGRSDSRGRTPLHLAAARGDVDLLIVLLQGGADISALDHHGNSALHYCGHVETIQCLVDHGADVLFRNNHGDTPLNLMKRKGVDEAAIKLTESLMELASQRAPVLQPLLKEYSVSSMSLDSDSNPSDIFSEFCAALGGKNLALIIAIILLLSTFVSLFMTSLSGNYKSGILIDDMGSNLKPNRDGGYPIEL